MWRGGTGAPGALLLNVPDKDLADNTTPPSPTEMDASPRRRPRSTGSHRSNGAGSHRQPPHPPVGGAAGAGGRPAPAADGLGQSGTAVENLPPGAGGALPLPRWRYRVRREQVLGSHCDEREQHQPGSGETLKRGDIVEASEEPTLLECGTRRVRVISVKPAAAAPAGGGGFHRSDGWATEWAWVRGGGGGGGGAGRQEVFLGGRKPPTRSTDCSQCLHLA